MEDAVADATPIVLVGDMPPGSTLRMGSGGKASPVPSATVVGIANGYLMGIQQYLKGVWCSEDDFTCKLQIQINGVSGTSQL